jgi:uncharacterized protein YkwD
MESIITARLCRSVTHIRGRQRFSAVVSVTAAVLVTAIGFAPAASAHAGRGCRHANTPIAGASRSALQKSVVCLINRQRSARHLPRLRENGRLNRSAQGWTNSMVRFDDFSHGSDFSARISAVGFNWSMVGENIATGFATPASVVRAWMASPGHCRNILTPSFLDVGTGLSRSPVRGFGSRGTWTQDFGLPMNRHAPSGNWGPANGCPY